MLGVGMAAFLAAIISIVDAFRVKLIAMRIIRALSAIPLLWIALVYFHGMFGIVFTDLDTNTITLTSLTALSLLIAAETISRWDFRGLKK